MNEQELREELAAMRMVNEIELEAWRLTLARGASDPGSRRRVLECDVDELAILVRQFHEAKRDPDSVTAERFSLPGRPSVPVPPRTLKNVVRDADQRIVAVEETLR